MFMEFLKYLSQLCSVSPIRLHFISYEKITAVLLYSELLFFNSMQ